MIKTTLTGAALIRALARHQRWVEQHAPDTRTPAAPLMRCFTDEEIRQGLAAVVLGRDRCAVCTLDRARHPPDHAFLVADPVDVFLDAARARSLTKRPRSRGVKVSHG